MTPTLVLYHRESCSYCRDVREEIERLNLNVQLKDIRINPKYREELWQATGRGRVPVLHIEHPDGSTQWLPESRAIIAYLRTAKTQLDQNG